MSWLLLADIAAVTASGQRHKLLASNIKNDAATEALLKDYSIGFADRKYPFLPKHMPVMMVQSYLVTAQFRDKTAE